MSKTSKVVLVDGSSYLFRAYHAMPPLTNSAGNPTGAIYGVVNMLRRLLKEEAPSHIGVIFDAPGKNFRHALYPDYKANRTEMPEDLAQQTAPLHAVIAAMGLPLICRPGIEADDVIGSLAVQMVAHGHAVLISTGDKDFTQLVNTHITLTNTMSGERLDPVGVTEKFGLPPERIIDYLTLVGDSVDNIPGIPSVGPKTALKWLTHYGSLENLVQHAPEITGKVGEHLRAHLDKLPLYQNLVTIQSDLDLKLGFDDLKIQPAHIAELKALFSNLEFKSWLKALDNEAIPVITDHTHLESSNPISAATVNAEISKDYTLVLSESDLDRWIEKVRDSGIVAVDTETTSLNYMEARCVGISLSVQSGVAAYIPFGHAYEEAPVQLDRMLVLQKLKPILEDAAIAKIGHHIKYDTHVFMNESIFLQGMQHDTMLESYLLNSTSTLQNLGAVTKKYLNIDTLSYEEVAGKGAKQVPFSEVHLELACAYAAEDADITWRLHETLWPRLNAREQALYQEIEQPLVGVLFRMERLGVCIDTEVLGHQSALLAKEMEGLTAQAYVLADAEFNLDSPKQLQAILYDKLNLPILQKTPTGQPSTAEPVLAELALTYPLPEIILRYRSLSKLKSTYTDKLPELVCQKTGRVHTSYHQAVVATGRLSSSDPNLQNIPIRTGEGRLIRQAFVAAPGYQIVAADYSQIELRIMAHLSKDPGLIRAFKEGQDVHQCTAMEVFGVPLAEVTADQRRKAKAINFGLIYGMSAFGLAKQLGVSRTEAAEYMAHYFARYPQVKVYMDQTRVLAAEQGYVETLRGRRLYLPNIDAKAPLLRQAAERAAINAPMQGTAADIIKMAMITIDRFAATQGDNFRMLMQVHDELVFEIKTELVPQYMESIRNMMIAAGELSVPLEVAIGVGPNWGVAH